MSKISIFVLAFFLTMVTAITYEIDFDNDADEVWVHYSSGIFFHLPKLMLFYDDGDAECHDVNTIEFDYDDMPIIMLFPNGVNKTLLKMK